MAPATADPSLHAFTVSGAFLLGAIVGAYACVRLVKYLTGYLRDNRDRDGGDVTRGRRGRGEDRPT